MDLNSLTDDQLYSLIKQHGFNTSGNRSDMISLLDLLRPNSPLLNQTNLPVYISTSTVKIQVPKAPSRPTSVPSLMLPPPPPIRISSEQFTTQSSVPMVSQTTIKMPTIVAPPINVGPPSISKLPPVPISRLPPAVSMIPQTTTAMLPPPVLSIPPMPSTARLPPPVLSMPPATTQASTLRLPPPVLSIPPMPSTTRLPQPVLSMPSTTRPPSPPRVVPPSVSMVPPPQTSVARIRVTTPPQTFLSSVPVPAVTTMLSTKSTSIDLSSGNVSKPITGQFLDFNKLTISTVAPSWKAAAKKTLDMMNAASKPSERQSQILKIIKLIDNNETQIMPDAILEVITHHSKASSISRSPNYKPIWGDDYISEHPAGAATELSRYEVSRELMMKCALKGHEFMNEVARYGGYGGLNLAVDEIIALFYFWGISDPLTGLTVNEAQVSFNINVAYLIKNDLSRLLAALRKLKFTDSFLINASPFQLMLAATNSSIVYLSRDSAHYKQLMLLPVSSVLNIAEMYYYLAGNSARNIPPYTVAGTSPKSKVESFAAEFNYGRDNEALYKKVGMMIPPRPPFNQLSIKSREKYFWMNLLAYENIQTRPGNIPPPPSLVNTDEDIAQIILSEYTDYELFDTYEAPIFDWRNRTELFKAIYNNAKVGSQWNITNQYCNNDAFDSTTMAEPMGQVDKNDPEDPILSYGVPRNYRCYLLSDLLASFRLTTGDEGEETFVFEVPDFVPVQHRKDPKLNYVEIREFTVESMKQLHKLLTELAQARPVQGQPSIFKPLIDKIDRGLELKNEALDRLNNVKKIFNQLNAEQKRAIEDYILNIFIYGMYNRYWKGPGYPWPGVSSSSDIPECTAPQREGYAIDEFKKISMRLAGMDQVTLNLVLPLPRIKYDWSSGTFNVFSSPTALVDKASIKTPYDFDPRGVSQTEMAVAKRTAEIQRLAYQYPDLLYYVLLKVNEQKFCQNNASDIATQSGYVYARKIFGWDDKMFNQRLKIYLNRNTQSDFKPGLMTRHGDIDPEDRRVNKTMIESVARL